MDIRAYIMRRRPGLASRMACHAMPPAWQAFRVALVAALLLAAATGVVRAGSAMWNLTANGSWNANASWLPATTYPNAIDDVAGVTNNASAARTISLNQEITIGTLNIGDSAATFYLFTIATGTGGTLTFDTSAGNATITKQTNIVVDVISAPITLNDDLDIDLQASTGGITISGNIDDNGTGKAITKRGANGITGVLILSGYNTFGGGVTLREGTLRVGSSRALGTGTLTISNGVLNTSAPNLVLANNNPMAWNGSFTNPGTYNMDLGAGDVTLNTTCVISNTANTLTVGGAISDGVSDFGLTKIGAGTLALTGTNSTYSGKTRIAGGTLRVASLNIVDGSAGSSLGKPTTVPNGTIDLGSNAVAGTLRYTGAGETSDRVINLAGTTGSGVIQNDGSGAITLTSANTATGVGTKYLYLQGSNTDTNTFAGNIVNGSGTVGLQKYGVGTWVLSGANTHTYYTYLYGGGTLVLDYATEDNFKLPNNRLYLGSATAFGGTITLSGGTHLEEVSAVTSLAGRSYITRTGDSSAILRLNAITRAASGTIDFGADSIAQTDTANVNGILGGYATVAGTNWAMNSTGGGNGPITTYSGYTVGLPDTGGSTNVNYSHSGAQTLTGAVLANTLKLANSADSQTLTLGANNLTFRWTTAANLGGLLYVGGFDNNYMISGTGKILTTSTTGELIINVNVGTLTISAPIVANGATAGTLTKTGSGTLVLSAASTYTGSTRIYQGVVNLQNATAAGSAAGGIIVAPGAALELQGGIAIGAETLALTGTGISNGGALRNVSGNNTYAGAITLGVDGARINSDSGTLTMSGTLATAALRDLTIGGAGIVTNTGVISGAGNIIKAGSGTLSLNAVNTFTGTTKINSGTVRVGKATGLGSATYATVLFGDSSSGILQLGTNCIIIGLNGDNTATVENGVTGAKILTVNNGSDWTYAGLLQNGAAGGTLGLTKTGPGKLTLSNPANTYTNITTISGGMLSVSNLANGGVASSIGAAAKAPAYLVFGAGNGILQYTGTNITIDRSYTLTATYISTIEITDPDTTLTISGASTAVAGNLTKTGSGTLVLSGANLHTGTTRVKAGTLRYGVNNALATGPVTVNRTNAVLDMGSYTDSVGLVTLTAGAITGTGGSRLTSTVNPFTMNNDSDVMVSANLAGAVGLTKSGSGILTLSGTNNTYSGTTRISNGTLRVNGSLRGAGQIIATNSGTLGGTGTVCGAIFIYTNSTLAPGSNAVGTLTLTNGVTFTGGTFRVNITTTNAGDYGQIKVTGGNVIITNATLAVNGLNYTPVGDYDKIWIINNTNAAGTVTGTFNDLPEGGETNIADWVYTIYYNADFDTQSGTNGNDVLLLGCVPTYVSLGWFAAIGRDSSVTARWKTECEVNSAGFNLYRSTSPTGTYTKVNGSLIWGLGTSSRGREYKYVDANVINGTTYYYKLESIEFSGRSTWYGPREARPGLDSDGDGMTDDWENFYFHNLTNNAGADPDGDGLTNYQEFLADTNPTIDEGADGDGWLSEPAAPGAGNSGIYKLIVKTNGIYRLTADYLTNNAGVTNLDSWVMAGISVYNQGSEIPLRVHDEDAAGFGSNDWFEFYGTGLDTRFTDANIYWLYPGTNSGLRMPEISGVGGEETPRTEAWFTAHYEQNECYQQSLPDEVPDDDHWFFKNYLYSPADPLSTTNLNVVITGVAPPGAEPTVVRVRVALRGVEDDLVAHHVQVTLNGEGLTDVADDGYWEGDGEYIFSAEISQYGLLADGTNVVAVTLPGDTDAAYELVLINWVEIDYLRTLQAESNSLAFSPAAGENQYSVGGYTTTNDLQVFRVVNATNVSVITNLSIAGSDPDPYIVTFADTVAEGETGMIYTVSAQEARLTPVTNIEDEVSDLRNTLNGADYIIIADGAFTNAIQRLAEHHAAQGLRVKTVAVQDVYDDFNFGILSPYAIRDFMAYARANWKPPAPVYLLLVGDATYDYRDYLNMSSKNYVPAKLVHDSELWETPSDNWYVALDGNDDYLPDMYVGRLPARTPSEVDTMVSKIIDYENADAQPDWTWTHRVMLVADDDDLFEDISDSVCSYLPANYLSTNIYLSDDGLSACEAAITNGINDGALITHYSGHGSIQSWAHEYIFQTNDISSLTNGVRLPFFIMSTCFNGYFITPPATNCESLAEELIRKSGGGASACFSPAGFSIPPQQERIVDGLFESIFNEGTFALGPAVTRAKQKTYDHIFESSRKVIQTFILFGDPAMKLKEWTGYTNDATVPWVILTSPTNGAENVADMEEIRITFSEAMDDVMTRAAFSISPQVAGTFAWEGTNLVFQPEDIYSLATVYTVTVKSNACDLAGNRLAADYRFSFARTYPAGTLAIDVTPAAGSWQLVATPATYHGITSGTGDLEFSAAEGTYGIIFNALAGYTAPSAQTQTVHRGVLATFSGVYNQCPVITEGTSIAVKYAEGDLAQGVSLALHASDAEADSLTWSIKTPATHGTASASGAGTEQSIHYQPQSNYRGVDMFVVKVTDTVGGEDEITVNVAFNHPPQIGAIADQSVELGQLLTFDVAATDADGTVPSLSMLVFPAGAVFTDHGRGTGTFSWTPDKVADLGDHAVRFAASDGQLRDIKDITIHVATFTVTSPEENAVARHGGDLDIAWTGQRSLGAVAIDIWQGTNFILNLTNNLPSPANQMTWQTVMPFSIRPGRNYRVSVTEANNTENWASSGPFTILVQCPDDFDGDGASDLSVYNPDSGNWLVYGSTTGFYKMLFDDADVSPVPWDYDGDGKTDFVVYQQKTGNWYMRMRISDSRYLADTAWLGGPGFNSAAGDYDGDGKMDIAVYQEESGQWYILLSCGGYSQDESVSGVFGGPGYRFVLGDYDGDGKTDPVLYQKTSGTWYGLLSDMDYALISVNLGGPEYQPVSGDFDGDGRSDFAVYKSTTGDWSFTLSDYNYDLYSINIGGLGYIPVPGDYDGDGKTDFVVYQEATGNWYGKLSGSGYATASTTFGGWPCRAVVPGP